MLTEITYALIIAIENYNQPEHFPKVDYATKDADNIKDALISSSITEEGNITLLKNEKATHTAIKTDLDRLTKYATSNDRILIFFAGHGSFENEINYILPVDSYKTKISITGISIEYILGALKSAKTKKCILLLDCCHSGFIPGTDVRDIDNSFMADELSYKYRNEEYCCGFASCKSDQTSISHPKLKNGVWSHFLIKALSGEASGYYKKGILFSNDLQSYLNKEVSSFVPKYSTKRREQTPVMFGNLSDKFIIADLNESINNKKRLAIVKDATLKAISLLNLDSGNIKSLSGFISGRHSVPKSIYSGVNDFIWKIAKDEIKKEVDELASNIKEKLRYKRKDIEALVEDGFGSISTPDFNYSIEIKQSENVANEYIIIRRLQDFTNSTLVLGDTFNQIFDGFFKKLEFKLNKEIDVESLIDIVEDMDNDDSIEVDYNPSDTSTCTITFNKFDYEIYVTSESVSFQTPFDTKPIELIEAYKEMRMVLLDTPDLNLLS